MFKVTMRSKYHCWNKFVFVFRTIDEAKGFVENVLDHFASNENEEALEIVISYSEEFKADIAKKGEDE